MTIVQLFASPFYGGPERQLLGLSINLPARFRTVFASFPNGGRCRPLLDKVREHDLEAIELKHDFPHLRDAVAEVADMLRRLRADVVCCNGYKPDILGWWAARKAGVPVVSISHGWTSANLRARLYETLDRWLLRWMDAVVCVSVSQAERVRRAGARPEAIHVIRNAVDVAPFDNVDPGHRQQLQGYFKTPTRVIVGAAGRLSPEKGFEVLIAAAAPIARARNDVGFVVFGDGELRDKLQTSISAAAMEGQFILAGFRSDVDKFIPHFDIAVLPSYTEGLPVFVLEASAARVPVVATAVGGTPEVVEDGGSGLLVPSGDAPALAAAITRLLDDNAERRRMGDAGRGRIEREFTFAAQSEAYERLFDTLVANRSHPPRRVPVGLAAEIQ